MLRAPVLSSFIAQVGPGGANKKEIIVHSSLFGPCLFYFGGGSIYFKNPSQILKCLGESDEVRHWVQKTRKGWAYCHGHLTWPKWT